MTTQDSDSEITGKVAASLTPPVVRLHVPRGEQSSGFFDLHTLYTMHVQPTPRALPPPLPASLPVVPFARDLPRPRPREALAPSPATRARPQPIGWYAVFVTWLATLTLATLSATQLPAHVATQPRPPAPTLAPTPTPTLPPTPTPTPAPSPGPPTIALSDLPRVAPAPARTAPRHAHAFVLPSPEPAPAPASVSPLSPAPAAAPSPPPASTANMSLEDLIRHEVAAEQKRLHPAAKP